MARSAASARLRPAPATAPWTLASTGFGIRTTTSIASWNESIRSPAACSMCPSSLWKPRTSPPAMKARPAPRRTTQRTVASASAARSAVRSASDSSRSRAFSTSGRFNVRTTMAPSRSTRTESLIRASRGDGSETYPQAARAATAAPSRGDGAAFFEPRDLLHGVAGGCQNLAGVLPESRGRRRGDVPGATDFDRAGDDQLGTAGGVVHRHEHPGGAHLRIVRDVLQPADHAERDALLLQSRPQLAPVALEEQPVQNLHQLAGVLMPALARAEARVRGQLLPADHGRERGPLPILVHQRQEEPAAVAGAVGVDQRVRRFLARRTRLERLATEHRLRQNRVRPDAVGHEVGRDE